MVNFLDLNREIFIYRSQKTQFGSKWVKYGKIQDKKYYLYEDGQFLLDAENTIEKVVEDILPEGVDLKIMLKAFNVKNRIELLPYLKNPIGDLAFSTSKNKTDFEKPILSNLEIKNTFPNILECEIEIEVNNLYPENEINPKKQEIQHLSLSGAQHKLQVSIIDGVVKEDYADFILKPYHYDFELLTYNEYLHLNFMRELGFEVPYSALLYDERLNKFHYLIKRFDIDENGNKLAQISLNALMQSDYKGSGNIEQISSFLKDRLDETQKILFLKYIYANALIYNNDLHKKNIAFVFKDNQLALSPVYDVINIYAVKNLDNNQTLLSINNKRNRIKIEDFIIASQNIGLDFKQTEFYLRQVLNDYIEKYQKFITIKLFEILKALPKSNSETFDSFKWLRNKLLNSYDKCLKTENYQIKLSNNEKTLFGSQIDEPELINQSNYFNPNSSSVLDSIKAEELAKSQAVKSEKKDSKNIIKYRKS